MVEVQNIWQSLWPELPRWGGEILALVRSLHPGFLAAFAVPAVLALLFRSVTAFLLTLLLAVIALFAFRIGTDALFRVALTGLTVAAGLLAVALAALLRRRTRQMHRMDWRMGELRHELDEANKKYEGEVYWRRAAERVTANEPG